MSQPPKREYIEFNHSTANPPGLYISHPKSKRQARTTAPSSTYRRPLDYKGISKKNAHVSQAKILDLTLATEVESGKYVRSLISTIDLERYTDAKIGDLRFGCLGEGIRCSWAHLEFVPCLLLLS